MLHLTYKQNTYLQCTSYILHLTSCIVCLCLCLTLFVSCESELQPISIDIKEDLYKPITQAEIAAFTTQLSVLFSDRELKSLLISSMREDEFDNHHILLAKLANETVSKNKDQRVSIFSDLFTGLENDVNLFDKVLSSFPLAEIKLVRPWSLQQLDSLDHKIPIAYVLGNDMVTNLKNERMLQTIDTSGGNSTIEAYERPSQIHLYIALAEDVKLFSKTSSVYKNAVASQCLSKADIVYENEEFVYLSNALHAEILNCLVLKKISKKPSVRGEKTNFPCPLSAREQNENRDQLKSFKFESREAVDKAFAGETTFGSGEAELQCIITISNPDGTTFTLLKTKTVRLSDVRQKRLFGRYRLLTVNMNTEIINWQPELFGSRMRYEWLEDDSSNNTGSNTVSFPVEFPTPTSSDPDATTTITVTSVINRSIADVELGSSFVEYCNNENQVPYQGQPPYNTGDLTFVIDLID